MRITNNWKTNEIILDFTKQETNTNKCKLCNGSGERRFCYSSKGWGYYCLKCCSWPVILDYKGGDMALNAPVGKEMEIVPAGTYKARCFKVIDLGTHHSEMFNNWQHQIMIVWELPETQMEDKQPFAVTGFYTLSLNAKSNLRKILVSWRGKEFATDEEAESLDLLRLCGVPAFLNIIHNKKGYANVANVLPLKKDECPSQINVSCAFSFESFNADVLGKFSDKLQEKIKTSKEYLEIQENVNYASVEDVNVEEASVDDIEEEVIIF